MLNSEIIYSDRAPPRGPGLPREQLLLLRLRGAADLRGDRDLLHQPLLGWRCAPMATHQGRGDAIGNFPDLRSLRNFAGISSSSDVLVEN